MTAAVNTESVVSCQEGEYGRQSIKRREGMRKRPEFACQRRLTGAQQQQRAHGGGVQHSAGGACGDRVRVAVVEQDLIVQLYAAPEVRRGGHSGE